jgi:hypothetical protein
VRLVLIDLERELESVAVRPSATSSSR